MKIYQGIDIVQIERIKSAIDRHPRLLQRFFTAGEVAHAEYKGALKYASLAGIFAAKEAAVKALGTGFREACWQDAEIAWQYGQPEVHYRGNLLKREQSLGIFSRSVSITHEKDYAIAGVILLGGNHVDIDE